VVLGLAVSLALAGLLKYPLFILPGAVLAADVAHGDELPALLDLLEVERAEFKAR